MSENIDVVLHAFRAVEQRNPEALVAAYAPDIEFHDAPSLPYGGSQMGLEAVVEHGPAWAKTWDPVQTQAERKMDPRVVAANDQEVVVLYRQRAVTLDGERFDHPVIGSTECGTANSSEPRCSTSTRQRSSSSSSEPSSQAHDPLAATAQTRQPRTVCVDEPIERRTDMQLSVTFLQAH
jgi:uncharacterized protein